MSDEPVFYKKNWVDRASTITVSSGDAVKGRLYDRDSTLQHATSGQNSDASDATYEVDFLCDGIAVSRTVDTIVFLNWNGKSGKVEYWTGSAWATFTGGTFTAQSAAYLVLAVTSQATTKIKVTISTTQTANAEKVLGELLALETLYTVPAAYGPVSIAQSHEPVAVVNEMCDGGKDVTLIRFAGGRTRRWRGEFAFSHVSESQFDSLHDTLYDQGEFYVRPEPDQRPDRFYFVTPVESAMAEGYSTQAVKSAGYSARLALKEHA